MSLFDMVLWLWAIMAGFVAVLFILETLVIAISKGLDHPNPNKLRKYHIMKLEGKK